MASLDRKQNGYMVGVDTGGTFTDCVLVRDGRISYDKALSTPNEFGKGVLDAISAATEQAGDPIESVLAGTRILAHGTTVALNSLINRTGSKVGLITTKGHEDAILIGRVEQKVAGLGERDITYAVRLDKASPIVPAKLIQGLTERADWKGAVLVRLREEEVRSAVSHLMRQGVEGIAVSLLWSFMNPSHERKVKEIIRDVAPDLFVTLSSDLVPIIGEYERTATTVMNTYLGPTVHQYTAPLAITLKKRGLRGTFFLMQSTGGVTPVDEAPDAAVNLLSSGPVGGVIASRVVGSTLNLRNIITTDVGGTSFDVGLIIDGKPQISQAPVFGRYRLLTNVVDVKSIGAGGGSIAYIEPRTGTLSVGPRSAGAMPGPACYGFGGNDPTVTDADLVLGRIDPDNYLGGRVQLSKPKAEAAIRQRIADPLGMDGVTAARAIVEIIDAHMADLVRKITIERGHDPRGFALFAFGGAGPTHVGGFGPQVGVRKVVISPYAPVFSAFGIAMSDVVRLYAKSEPMRAPLKVGRVNEIYAALEAKARRDVHKSDVPPEEALLARSVDIRFRYQIHETRIPVPSGELTDHDLEQVLEDFSSVYEQTFGSGTAYQLAGIEFVTFHLTSVVRVGTPALPMLQQASGPASELIRGERPVFFDSEYHSTPIYSWGQLRAGHEVHGPAIIESSASSCVVHPNQQLQVDDYGNLILNTQGPED